MFVAMVLAICPQPQPSAAEGYVTPYIAREGRDRGPYVNPYIGYVKSDIGYVSPDIGAIAAGDGDLLRPYVKSDIGYVSPDIGAIAAGDGDLLRPYVKSDIAYVGPDIGAAAAEGGDLAGYVNPFIGTAPAPGAGYGLEFDGGDTFPGAVYPAGMLAWSPDTAETRLPGGYAYADHTLKGLSLTHFSGRGCTVYQDVPILPVLGGDARPTFQHVNESASPGDYAVTLDNGVSLELSATARTGFGRFTFPNSTPASLAIDAAGSVNQVLDAQLSVDADKQMVTGHVQSQVGCGSDAYTLYFAIAFDRPFASVWTSATNATLTFDGPIVQAKPAISYVSIDNALENLSTEDPGWDLTAVRSEARAAWNDVLGRVEVQGGSTDELTSFYTALYHAFLEPNVFSDANGEYIGFDDQVHQVTAGHAQYANIAGWDQYRALIHLRAILAPSQASDIVQSLVNDAEQGGGGMPRWEQANRNSAGMVGDSPAVYVANAYAFGARDFDVEAALTALDLGASTIGTTSGGHLVREFGEAWLRLGYVPDQPSITLEYATDDFALAQFARTLGRQDLYDRYTARAAGWTNTFNPASGFIEPRDAAGAFESVDHARWCCGFVEGNAAQYTWMVPFDTSGLIAKLGGPTMAIARLDNFFSQTNAGPNRPYAWIGNEPSLAAAWLYDFAGAPEKTRAVVDRIRKIEFRPTADGLPGNDDGGTLSAWYVFAALGLYPAIPGVGGFATAEPLFDAADVHLANGAELRVSRQVGMPPWIDWSPN